MPITKNPLEYYRYYCASQRRVEQWVQDTGQLILQNSPAQSESLTTQWRGFLEDPGLATPISLPPPLDRREHRHETGGRHLPGVPEQDSQAYPQSQTPEIERLDDADDIDHDIPRTTSQRRSTVTTTPKGSHDDPTRSQRSRAGTQQQQQKPDENPVGDLVPALPSSSKHSKDSKQSRHTSKSRNSSSTSSRKRNEAIDFRRSILIYVPYGIIPFLFAMTTGSSAVSLAAASIMLAGFFCLDYTSTNRHLERRKSRK